MLAHARLLSATTSPDRDTSASNISRPAASAGTASGRPYSRTHSWHVGCRPPRTASLVRNGSASSLDIGQRQDYTRSWASARNPRADALPHHAGCVAGRLAGDETSGLRQIRVRGSREGRREQGERSDCYQRAAPGRFRSSGRRRSVGARHVNVVRSTIGRGMARAGTRHLPARQPASRRPSGRLTGALTPKR
jgi:hypothetical protein